MFTAKPLSRLQLVIGRNAVAGMALRSLTSLARDGWANKMIRAS